MAPFRRHSEKALTLTVSDLKVAMVTAMTPLYLLRLTEYTLHRFNYMFIGTWNSYKAK